jgi:hypothetical protein
LGKNTFLGIYNSNKYSILSNAFLGTIRNAKKNTGLSRWIYILE